MMIMEDELRLDQEIPIDTVECGARNSGVKWCEWPCPWPFSSTPMYVQWVVSGYVISLTFFAVFGPGLPKVLLLLAINHLIACVWYLLAMGHQDGQRGAAAARGSQRCRRVIRFGRRPDLGGI